MSERPTPITDAALNSGGQWIQRLADVARDLERQLADALDTIEHLRMENGLIEFYKMKEQLAEAREQRDALLEALEEIRGCAQDATITLHPDADAKGCVDDILELAEQAIGLTKGGAQ